MKKKTKKKHTLVKECQRQPGVMFPTHKLKREKKGINYKIINAVKAINAVNFEWGHDSKREHPYPFWNTHK